MAGPGQLHLVRGLHLTAVPRARQPGRRERQVQGGQRDHRVLQRPGLLTHQPREGAQDALLLLVLLGPQLPNPVVGLHDRHGLDEDRLARPGAVVHDPRHRRARRRLHGQHGPAAALGGERLLQMRPQAHGQLPQKIGRLPPRGGEAPSDGGELRRGRVEQPAAGVEGAVQGRLHTAHRAEIRGGEGRGEPGRRLLVGAHGLARLDVDARRGQHLGQGLGVEGRVTGRGRDRVAHVERAPRPAHAQVAQAQRLLGGGGAVGHLGRLRRGRERQREGAPSGEGGHARQPLPHHGQLEQLGAPGIHSPGRLRRWGLVGRLGTVRRSRLRARPLA